MSLSAEAFFTHSALEQFASSILSTSKINLDFPIALFIYKNKIINAGGMVFEYTKNVHRNNTQKTQSRFEYNRGEKCDIKRGVLCAKVTAAL